VVHAHGSERRLEFFGVRAEGGRRGSSPPVGGNGDVSSSAGRRSTSEYGKPQYPLNLKIFGVLCG
jgi:hypothetical protein